MAESGSVNDIQERVATIWCRVLDVEGEGSFYGAGGDSLKAVRLLYEIEEETGIEIDMVWLLEHPSLAELQARCVTRSIAD